MADWTPWHVVTLILGLATIGLGFTTLAAWWVYKARQCELAALGPDGQSARLPVEVRGHPQQDLTALGPDGQSARLLGSIIGQSGGELDTESADELIAIFARSSPDQKQAIVGAINGLIAAAVDGPQGIANFAPRVLSLARRLGAAEGRPAAV